ncbi:MAG: hypothetical protein HY232_14860 [Acidobacteria bacterium]|nr:hypothetical protein [Acidobacteriota bacterium]
MVKELQLAVIADPATANDFLIDTYLDSLNERFTVPAKSPVDFHRPVPKDSIYERSFVWRKNAR